MIIGFSGSGKSTLSKEISEEYGLPILYIDKTIYNANWKRKTEDESLNEIASFLRSNKNWVVDGNGVNKMFDERAELADKIIYMCFSRCHCYKAAKARYKEYKNKERESRPEGCHEKFDHSFKMWILFGGRKKERVNRFNEILKKHPQKAIILKNKKDVAYFKENMDNLLLR